MWTSWDTFRCGSGIVTYISIFLQVWLETPASEDKSGQLYGLKTKQEI